MENRFLVCDPGATGALGIFNKDTKQLLEYICNFNKQKYKDFFIKYKGLKLLLEFIPNVMGGAYASFLLGKNIGEIKGLAYGLCEIIEKGNMPKQWKSPWNNDITELKKVIITTKTGKKKHLDNKEIDIQICEKYYPEINLLQPELDKNGNIIYIKKGIDKDKPKMKKHDGLADIYLMGQSAIIKGLV